MMITVICQCSKRFEVPEQYAGKKGKCPGCGRTVLVPGPGASRAAREEGPAASAPVPPIRSANEANTIGNELLNAGDLETATKVFEKGLHLAPDHLDAAFNLAVAYRLAGRFAEAEQVCGLLLKLNPNDADARAELTACREKDATGSGAYKAARRSFLAAPKAATPAPSGPRPEAPQSGPVEVRDYRSESAAQFEADARAGKSLGPEIDSLVAELILIGRTDGFLGAPGDTFDDSRYHRRAREIGEHLNRQGGFQLMQAVGYKILVLPHVPRGLEHCWNGIGSWCS